MKRAAAWAQDEKTAVEVPTSRSQQRLKAIAKPGGGWDEEVHTVARPADAILPAAAFRGSQAPVPVLDVSPAASPLLAPSSRVVPPPLPSSAAAAPSLPPSRMAQTAAVAPSYGVQPGDDAAFQLEQPTPPAGLRPGHWALVCLAAAVCAALGYAAVTLGFAP
jgi:hypothetical protein